MRSFDALSLCLGQSAGDERLLCAAAFLATRVQPNVLVILDNSGSMNCLAYYGSYNPDQFSTGHYYGYFEPTTYYYYDTTLTPNRWKPVNSYSPHKTYFDASVTNPIAKGDFLNWATMSKLDVAKKILIGGKASAPTAAYNVATDRH